jgi:long-chain acyl-CoA synthetase
MLPHNLGHLFDGPLRSAPDSAAVLQGEVTLTYRELDARCNRLANGLAARGVQAGDRVALMFDNDYRFVEALFAPMRLGAVSVPMNTKLGDDALGYILEDCGATVLIAGAAMARRAHALAGRVPRVSSVIGDGPTMHGCSSYQDLLQSHSDQFERRAIDPDSVCMQPYTSGSTGKPKGVLLTHAGQIWNADAVAESLHADPRERALVCVPLFHKNAMSCAVKPFLLRGGPIVILRGFDPVEVIAAIENYRITYMTGVPAMYKRMLQQRDALDRHDTRSLAYAVCGSAEVPDELLRDFERVFGAPIAEIYGLTEGGPLPLINARSGLRRQGSCGRPFPRSEAKIVAADKRTEVAAREVGELLVRNPGVARGYWKIPEATARKFRDGWLHTGDLFRRDEDGFHYFVGREDDMMNVAGENVYPKEVEDVLLTHPQVRDACVVPIVHALKGQVPVAFLVAADAGLSAEDVKTFFIRNGPAYAHPRQIAFLPALPLGSTGKPDRAALRAMAREKWGAHAD